DDDGIWYYRGGIKIQDYITPGFDETFNPNYYAGWRHRRVAPVVAEYEQAATSPLVQARFRRYRKGWALSASQQQVNAYFEARGITSQHQCWQEAACNGET